MRSLLVLVVPVLALALQPTQARASGCYLGPFTTADVPSGCPVVVWQDQTFTFEPKVFVKRDGAFVDVTGAVERETVMLGVDWPDYDCHGVVTSVNTQSAPYEKLRVTLAADVAVGEELYLGGNQTTPMGRVTAAAACTAPDPTPVCGHLPPTCEETGEDDHDGGCNTSGRGAGLAFALLALALAMRPRR